MSIGVLAEAVGLPCSVVRSHLRILVRAGMVLSRVGRHPIVAINASALERTGETIRARNGSMKMESRLAMLVAAVTAIRIAVATTLGLTDTEAYYASWTRVLDWSYYDHPPLLAWLTSVTMRLSSSPLGIRLVPIACSAIFALLLHRFASRLFSPRAGFFAVVVTLCMPAFVFIGFVSNPEAPLAPLWILALSLIWDLRDRDEPWRPIALGAVIGAAFLAKYTAILVMPVALGWIASSSRTRRWLRRPAFWAGALVALAVASPVIVWNVQHGWPPLTLHLSERMAAPSLATYAENAVRTVSGQIALFQPLALIGLVATLVVAVRRWRDDRFRLLALAGVPVLIFFFVMMTRVRDAEPHWTMVGWMPAAIAAGAWLDEVRISRALAWYVRITVAVTVSMASISARLRRFVKSNWVRRGLGQYTRCSARDPPSSISRRPQKTLSRRSVDAIAEIHVHPARRSGGPTRGTCRESLSISCMPMTLTQHLR